MLWMYERESPLLCKQLRQWTSNLIFDANTPGKKVHWLWREASTKLSLTVIFLAGDLIQKRFRHVVGPDLKTYHYFVEISPKL